MKLDRLAWRFNSGSKGSTTLMEKLSTVFGFSLYIPVEHIANQRHCKTLDAGKVKNVKNSIIRYLNDIRSEAHFVKIYDESKDMSEELELEQIELPAFPKTWYIVGSNFSKDHGCSTADQYYRTQYLAVVLLLLI